MLADSELWRIDCGDNLEWLRSLPDRYASLVLKSPPYSDARTYGIGYKHREQGWVDWMVPRTVESCRVSSGLCVVNMAGVVRDWRYSPVVEWLVTELTRNHGLIVWPSPYVYFRVGVPGSGGEHAHRRDWEPVYCFAFPDRVPPAWSDNTALGHPPKWAPGGEMSNRLTDGTRVNQWGHPIDSGATVTDADGVTTSKGQRPSHKLASKDLFGISDAMTRRRQGNGKREKHFRHDDDGNLKGAHDRDICAIANPGNVVQEMYSAEEVAAILAAHGIKGDCQKHLVGGGVMGHPLAHENEAPMTLTLAEFFVRSFAPPGSIVVDDCAGSGTTLDAALKWDRRGHGCDIREEQCEIARRRLSSAAGLFALT